MKKIFTSGMAFLLVLTLLASCTQTTCPTYASHEKEQVKEPNKTTSTAKP